MSNTWRLWIPEVLMLNVRWRNCRVNRGSWSDYQPLTTQTTPASCVSHVCKRQRPQCIQFFFRWNCLSQCSLFNSRWLLSSLSDWRVHLLIHYRSSLSRLVQVALDLVPDVLRKSPTQPSRQPRTCVAFPVGERARTRALSGDVCGFLFSNS